MRIPRRPSFPMLIAPRMALDDACSEAFRNHRYSRQLALRAYDGAVRAGDRATALSAQALANALELLED